MAYTFSKMRPRNLVQKSPEEVLALAALRAFLDPEENVVLAGYQWTKDGTHSGNEAYQFRGDYLRWKVIHAS